eukprot:TRINITY_DN16638_c0_g1_i2.p1 TRINITY_DN16638_c0_g1~~TRINITY_DN16638_c0_g1_i2.p1  ORF type:complete len:158 (-),score=8.37 TRINITY_DN16638_c0_g1_i2:162-605(-)
MAGVTSDAPNSCQFGWLHKRESIYNIVVEKYFKMKKKKIEFVIVALENVPKKKMRNDNVSLPNFEMRWMEDNVKPLLNLVTEVLFFFLDLDVSCGFVVTTKKGAFKLVEQTVLKNKNLNIFISPIVLAKSRRYQSVLLLDPRTHLNT